MGLFNKQVVIYKDTSDSKQYLQKLEELLQSAFGAERYQLECDIAMTKAGIAGEEQVLFELRNSGMDMYVLQDIYLVDGDLSAQIDFYVITPKINFIIECKNLYGNIEIDRNGNFIRTFEYRGRKIREGIYSPITQNERHLQVLKDIRAKESNDLMKIAKNHYFDTFFKSLVVLANPKTVVYDRYAPKEIKSKVIRADQLISTIKKICRESDELPSSTKAMERCAEIMLKRNVEERKEYLQKYRELQKLVEKQKTRILEEGTLNDAGKVSIRFCPICGAQLILRTAKRGSHTGEQFWGCSGFPQCRFMEGK